MRAGFARVDITPPPGTRKIGWLKEIIGERALDPLWARAAVVEDVAGGRVGIVVLDVLSVPWRFVCTVRAAVRSVPPDRLLVTATHNHAGPAIAREAMVQREEAYTVETARRAAAAVDASAAALAPAVAVSGRAGESSVSFNRRVVMADGTVRTHGSLADEGAVRIEGPVDPEVAVLAFHAPGGARLGLLVHHALHPTDHGGDEVFTAGWPGALCTALEAGVWPRAIFVQGALGNISTQDPAGTPRPAMKQVGEILAAAAGRAVATAGPAGPDETGSAAEDLRLPYRDATEAEIRGTVRGAQRFIDAAIYDAVIPRALDKIRANGTQPATVHALRIGHTVLAALPCEPFVELGLVLKATSPGSRRVWPLGCANGMVGYVPTREAFARGGYETTFIRGSHLAPEAGEMLVAAASRCAAAA